MPASSFSTGNGSDRMNIVNTGAMNDIGQLTICENSIDRAVPSAMRSMRTLAILMRLASADSVLSITETLESEGIRQKTGNSNVNLANEIEEPVVSCVNDHRGLRSHTDIKSLGLFFQFKLDLDREALRIT